MKNKAKAEKTEKTEKAEKKLTRKDLEVEYPFEPQKIYSLSVIDLLIDKIGAKAFLRVVGGRLLRQTMDRSVFPSAFFATQKDEDKAETATALFFLKNHWKECSDKGMKEIEAKMKEAREKQEKEEQITQA